MLEIREPQHPDESDEDFEEREKAHWDRVAENEQKLLDARERHRKRMGYENSNR